MKQILSFVIALVMIVSLFPAMIFTSSAEDALPMGTLLMRTEGIDKGWRMAEAGAKISFLGDGGIDAGNKTVLSGVHSTTNGRYGSEGGQTWMRSNNIWAYGYAVEIKDATGPVVAKITLMCGPRMRLIPVPGCKTVRTQITPSLSPETVYIRFF